MKIDQKKFFCLSDGKGDVHEVALESQERNPVDEGNLEIQIVGFFKQVFSLLLWSPQSPSPWQRQQ